MTTTCPAIATADDAEVELSSYDTAVGTVVIVDCKGFAQHVEPGIVQCGTNGQWSPSPSTDCSFDLDTQEKVLLGVLIGAGCLLIFGLLWILCYCCWCWSKDRKKFRYWKYWKNRDKDSYSDEPADYRQSRQYRETFGRDNSESPRTTRKEINIYNIRDDNRLSNRYADDYRESKNYKTTIDKRHDDKSDYSDIRDYRKSRRVEYSASDARDYRQSRRYRRDSDPTDREYRDTRRDGDRDNERSNREYRDTRRDGDRDNERSNREYRYSRKYDSDDDRSFKEYRNRNRHDRDYRESKRYERDDTRLDHGPRITRRFDDDPPPYRESENIRYIDRPVPVFIDRYPPPFTNKHDILDGDFILREKPHHRNDYRKRHGFYGNEIHDRLPPFEMDSDTIYLKYHPGNKPPIGDNIVPSVKIVELEEGDRIKHSEYSTTDVVPYNQHVVKSRGRETGVHGPETNYFLGRQDFDLPEREPIVNKGLDHVLYHGNGKATEIFENAESERPLSATRYFGDTANWKEW